MADDGERREVEEALAAGRACLASLGRAREAVKSAKGWGMWDILGGGAISGLVKHARIDEARGAMRQAQRDLGRFADELDDVGSVASLRVDVGEFATFADLFMDGAIADIYVQSKLERADDALEQATREVQRAMARLEARL